MSHDPHVAPNMWRTNVTPCCIQYANLHGYYNLNNVLCLECTARAERGPTAKR